jgi:hypothetical protein
MKEEKPEEEAIKIHIPMEATPNPRVVNVDGYPCATKAEARKTARRLFEMQLMETMDKFYPPKQG